MVQINFYLQSIIIGVAILLGLASAIDQDFLSYLLTYQLFVGLAQLFVCVNFLLRDHHRTFHLKIYTTITAIFLTLLFIVPKMLEMVVFTFPWALALYFWFISYQAYKKSKS